MFWRTARLMGSRREATLKMWTGWDGMSMDSRDAV